VRYALSPLALALSGLAGLAACGLTIVGAGDSAAPNESAGDSGTSSGGPGPGGRDAETLEGGGSGDASTAADAGFDANWRPTPTGYALSFQASLKQYVQISSIAIPDDFTLEAWVKPHSIGAEMMIISEDCLALNPDNQFRLAVTGTGIPYFAMTDKDSKSYGLIQTAANLTYPVSGPPLAIGKWAHLAVTKAGSQFAFYLDGTAFATFTADQADYQRNRNFDFRIGARMGNGGPDSYFDGLIDDVRVYEVGRPPAAIQSDWQSEILSIPSDLADYWRFDEGSGTLVADSAGPWTGLLKGDGTTTPTWIPGSAF
jgi:hypothetical protein